jgi:hypothetical protein
MVFNYYLSLKKYQHGIFLKIHKNSKNTQKIPQLGENGLINI